MKIDVRGQSTYFYTGGVPSTPETVGRQPAILFIHGAQQDHSCWLLQSRWFAHHGYSVLAPDLPGHGRSAGEALESVEAMADWIVAALDALGLERACLVGHSMGSLVVLECAARHPTRVEKAALIGTSLPMPVAPVLLDASRDDEPKAAAMINDWSYSYGQMGGSPTPGVWMLGVNKRLMARQPRGTFFRDMNACNAYVRALESLSAVGVPTLIVAGAQDRMTPPKAAAVLEKSIPGARLTLLPGCGHALMAEQPDAVLDVLRGFFGGQ